MSSERSSGANGSCSDGEGFSRLYAKAAPALFTWAAARLPRRLAARLDPEDVVQEVCLRAYDRFDTYDPSDRPFRAWMFGIAHNVMREALRQLAAGGPPLQEGGSERDALIAALPDDATTISRRVARDEVLRRLIERIAGLGESERKLLALRGLEGLPHRQVAERLGLTEDAIQKQWQRLLRKLDDGSLPPDLLAGH